MVNHADITLSDIAAELGAALKARGFMLSMAESCTGGMVAEAVTSVAGSSAWFDRGFVTYSNAAAVYVRFYQQLAEIFETHDQAFDDPFIRSTQE